MSSTQPPQFEKTGMDALLSQRGKAIAPGETLTFTLVKGPSGDVYTRQGTFRYRFKGSRQSKGSHSHLSTHCKVSWIRSQARLYQTAIFQISTLSTRYSQSQGSRHFYLYAKRVECSRNNY